MTTIRRQVECVEREIKQRDRVYPRLIEQGKMSAAFAAEEALVMRAVLATLQGLAKTERLI